MLVDANLGHEPGTGSIIAILFGDSSPQRLDQGLYEINHFGCTGWPAGFEDFSRDLGEIPNFGVCDYPRQVLERYPSIETSERGMLITFTRLDKATQPQEGGWRWHKWGEYIGDQDPQCEYLAHEPIIETVYVFHVYVRKEEPWCNPSPN